MAISITESHYLYLPKILQYSLSCLFILYTHCITQSMLASLKVTVPELLFEKTGLISELHRLFVLNNETSMGLGPSEIRWNGV